MKASLKAIVLSLLLVLLAAQERQTVYTIGGQSFRYTYGSGSEDPNNHGDRPEDVGNAFVADSTYTPPTVAPPPATITCPTNQVYNNILCECVCLRGYYM